MNLSTHKKSEVDLRVAQELKNNQDFIYETNQSLQNLSQGILSLAKDLKTVVSMVENRIQQVEIDFENMKEQVKRTCKDCVTLVGNISSSNLDLTRHVEDKIDDIEIQFNNCHDFITSFIPEIEKIDHLEKDLIQKHDYFNLAIDNLRNHVKEQSQILKTELTPKIPEVDPIKKQLDERMQILKVDFDGLVREINILKKAQAYGDKKFENIYTLIERLKAAR